MSQQGRRVITVFGSSRSQSDSEDYRQAEELGRLLAKAGFDVCNGGYAGSMEAVSRGARQAGGRTTGVTLEVFERDGNAWLDEEIRAETLFLRMERLIELGDGFVVLPGGSGTLAELALTMNLLFIGAVRPRPLVLLGDDWRAVMECFFSRLRTLPRERDLLAFASTPADAVRLLQEQLA